MTRLHRFSDDGTIPGAGLSSAQSLSALTAPAPYDAHGRRAAERARDAEVAAQIAAARATLAAGRRDEAADVYDPDLPPYEWYREMADTPPDPAPAVSRCDTCGYLVTAVGHQIACGDTP
jgi:hypothetical protein